MLDGLISVYVWICLAWAVFASTALLVIVARDAAKNSRMRREYWDWVYSGYRDRK